MPSNARQAKPCSEETNAGASGRSNEVTRNQKALLLAAPLLVIGVIGMAVTARHWSTPAAIGAVFAAYWGGCWLLTLLLVPIAELKRLYRTPPARGLRERLFAWAPPMATGVAI